LALGAHVGNKSCLASLEPTPVTFEATNNRSGRVFSMAPVVALDPLRNAVLGLAAAVLVLALVLVIQRGLAWIQSSRSGRRLPRLTRLVYEAVQSTPVDHSALGRLSRFDRGLVRSILLGLALDLRGDTGDALSELYRRLGFV
jgi:hypothetical protein